MDLCSSLSAYSPTAFPFISVARPALCLMPHAMPALAPVPPQVWTLWTRCESLAKFCVLYDPNDPFAVEATPSKALGLRPFHFKELQSPIVAMGLARWIFNAISHRLPQLPAAPGQSARLPPDGDGYYWSHVGRLVARSEELTTRARVQHSAARPHEVVYSSRPSSKQ